MPELSNVGILILRVALGVIFFAHGAQKLLGWFGGKGLSGAAGMMTAMGIRPARLFGVVVSLGEFLGGLGMAAGILTPFAAAGILGSMTVAAVKVHWPKGFWNHNGGLEFPLILAAVAFVIGLIGPGAYSLDAAWGIRLPEPWTYIIVLGATLVVVLYVLTRPAAPKPDA